MQITSMDQLLRREALAFAQIYFLVSARNRLSVALNWLWIYARDQCGARLITWWGGDVDGTAPFPRGDGIEKHNCWSDDMNLIGYVLANLMHFGCRSLTRAKPIPL